MNFEDISSLFLFSPREFSQLNFLDLEWIKDVLINLIDTYPSDSDERKLSLFSICFRLVKTVDKEVLVQHDLASIYEILIKHTVSLISQTALRTRAVNLLLSLLETKKISRDEYLELNKSDLVNMKIFPADAELTISIKDYIDVSMEKMLVLESDLTVPHERINKQRKDNDSSNQINCKPFGLSNFKLFNKSVESINSNKESLLAPNGKSCDIILLGLLRNSQANKAIFKIFKSDYPILNQIMETKEISKILDFDKISTNNFDREEIILETESVLALLKLLGYLTVKLEYLEIVISLSLAMISGIFQSMITRFTEKLSDVDLANFELINKITNVVQSTFMNLNMKEPLKIFNSALSYLFLSYSCRFKKEFDGICKLTASTQYILLSDHVLRHIKQLNEDITKESEITWSNDIDINEEKSLMSLLKCSSKRWLIYLLNCENGNVSNITLWLSFIKEIINQTINVVRERNAVIMKASETILYVDECEPTTDEFGLNELFRENSQDKARANSIGECGQYTTMRMESQTNPFDESIDSQNKSRLNLAIVAMDLITALIDCTQIDTKQRTRNSFNKEAMLELVELASIIDEEIVWSNDDSLSKLLMSNVVRRLILLINLLASKELINLSNTRYILKLLSINLSNAIVPTDDCTHISLDLGPTSLLILLNTSIIQISSTNISSNETLIKPDDYIQMIWNLTLKSLHYHLTTQDHHKSMDMRLEYLQYLLTMYHQLSTVKLKETIVLNLLNNFVELTDHSKYKKLNNTILLTRMLLLVKYFLHHFYEPAAHLSYQIQYHLIGKYLDDAQLDYSSYLYDEFIAINFSNASSIFHNKSHQVATFYDLTMPWSISKNSWNGSNVDTMLWQKLVKSPDYPKYFRAVMRSMQIVFNSSTTSTSSFDSLAMFYYNFLAMGRLLEILPADFQVVFQRSTSKYSMPVEFFYDLYQRSSEMCKSASVSTLIKMVIKESQPDHTNYPIWDINLLSMLLEMIQNQLQTDSETTTQLIYQLDIIAIFVSFAYNSCKQANHSKCFMQDCSNDLMKPNTNNCLLIEVVKTYKLTQQRLQSEIGLMGMNFYPGCLDQALELITNSSASDQLAAVINIKQLTDMIKSTEALLDAQTRSSLIKARNILNSYKSNDAQFYLSNYDTSIEAIRKESYRRFMCLTESCLHQNYDGQSLSIYCLNLLMSDLRNFITKLDLNNLENLTPDFLSDLVYQLMFNLAESPLTNSGSSLINLIKSMPTPVMIKMFCQQLFEFLRYLTQQITNNSSPQLFHTMQCTIELLIDIFDRISDQASARHIVHIVMSDDISNNRTEIDFLLDLLVEHSSRQYSVPIKVRTSVLQLYIMIMEKYQINRNDNNLRPLFTNLANTILHLGRNKEHQISVWLEQILMQGYQSTAADNSHDLMQYLASLVVFSQKLVVTSNQIYSGSSSSTEICLVDDNCLPVLMIKSILKLDNPVRDWLKHFIKPTDISEHDTGHNAEQIINLHIITDCLCQLVNVNCCMSLYVDVVQLLIDWNSEINTCVFNKLRGEDGQFAQPQMDYNSPKMNIICTTLAIIYNHISSIICAMNSLYQLPTDKTKPDASSITPGNYPMDLCVDPKLYLLEHTSQQIGYNKDLLEKLLFSRHPHGKWPLASSNLASVSITNSITGNSIESQRQKSHLNTGELLEEDELLLKSVKRSPVNPLDEQLCTFAATQKEFTDQHWYYCYTCKMTDNEGVCTICAKVCHVGHDIVYSKRGGFFCDCGAKGPPFCVALTRRNSSDKSSHNKRLESLQNNRQYLSSAATTASGGGGTNSQQLLVDKCRFNNSVSANSVMNKLNRSGVPSTSAISIAGGLSLNTMEKSLRKTLKSEPRSRNSANFSSFVSSNQTSNSDVNGPANSANLHRSGATRRKLGTSAAVISSLPPLSLSPASGGSAGSSSTAVTPTSSTTAPPALSESQNHRPTFLDSYSSSSALSSSQEVQYTRWIVDTLRRRLINEQDTLSVLLDTSSLLDDCFMTLRCLTAQFTQLYETWTVDKISQLKQQFHSLHNEPKTAQQQIIMNPGVDLRPVPENHNAPSNNSPSLVPQHDLSGIPSTASLVNEIFGLNVHTRNISSYIQRNVLAVLSPPPQTTQSSSCTLLQHHFLAVALTSEDSRDKARIVIYSITNLIELAIDSTSATNECNLLSSNTTPDTNKVLSAGADTSNASNADPTGIIKSFVTDQQARPDLLESVCTATLPFIALSMAVNPSNQQIMAVCGLKEVLVLTLTAMGSVSGKIPVIPLFEDNAQFIIKSMWLLGTPNHLVIVLTQSIQIFDLAHSCTSPIFHFKSVEARFKDATFAYLARNNSNRISPNNLTFEKLHDDDMPLRNYSHYDQLNCFIFVMSDSGCIHCKKLDKECSGSSGFYLAEMLDWSPDLFNMTRDSKTGVLGNGGASIHFDHTMQLLLHSYNNGRTICSVVDTTGINDDDVVVVKNFHLPTSNIFNSKSSDNSAEEALINWQNLPAQDGLLSAVGKTSSCPVFLLIEPTQFKYQLLDESKSLSVTAQTTQTAGTTNSTANSSSTPTTNNWNNNVTDVISFSCRKQRRSLALILYIDGRIRLMINNVHSDNSNAAFWSQLKFTNNYLDDCLSGHAIDPVNYLATSLSDANSLATVSVNGVEAINAVSRGRKSSHISSHHTPLSTISTKDDVFLNDPACGPVPIDFFEHCEQSLNVSFGGDRLLELYSQVILNHRINNEDQTVTLVSKNPVAITITNERAQDSIIVGVRMGLNVTDASKVPQYFEVQGRKIYTTENISKNRLIDIGLYKSEICHNDKVFTIIVGPAHNQNDLIVIDTIKVYVRPRTSLPWLQNYLNSHRVPSVFRLNKDISNKTNNKFNMPCVTIRNKINKKIQSVIVNHNLSIQSQPLPRSIMISAGLQLLTASFHFRQALSIEGSPNFSTSESANPQAVFEYSRSLVSSYLPSNVIMNSGVLMNSCRQTIDTQQVVQFINQTMLDYAQQSIEKLCANQTSIGPESVMLLRSAIYRLCNCLHHNTESSEMLNTPDTQDNIAQLLQSSIQLVVQHHCRCNCLAPLNSIQPTIQLLYSRRIRPVYYRRADLHNLPSLLVPLIHTTLVILIRNSQNTSTQHTQFSETQLDNFTKLILQLLLHHNSTISHTTKRTISQFLSIRNNTKTGNASVMNNQIQEVIAGDLNSSASKAEPTIQPKESVSETAVGTVVDAEQIVLTVNETSAPTPEPIVNTSNSNDIIVETGAMQMDTSPDNEVETAQLLSLTSRHDDEIEEDDDDEEEDDDDDDEDNNEDTASFIQMIANSEDLSNQPRDDNEGPPMESDMPHITSFEQAMRELIENNDEEAMLDLVLRQSLEEHNASQAVSGSVVNAPEIIDTPSPAYVEEDVAFDEEDEDDDDEEDESDTESDDSDEIIDDNTVAIAATSGGAELLHNVASNDQQHMKLVDTSCNNNVAGENATRSPIASPSNKQMPVGGSSQHAKKKHQHQQILESHDYSGADSNSESDLTQNVTCPGPMNPANSSQQDIQLNNTSLGVLSSDNNIAGSMLTDAIIKPSTSASTALISSSQSSLPPTALPSITTTIALGNSAIASSDDIAQFSYRFIRCINSQAQLLSQLDGSSATYLFKVLLDMLQYVDMNSSENIREAVDNLLETIINRLVEFDFSVCTSQEVSLSQAIQRQIELICAIIRLVFQLFAVYIPTVNSTPSPVTKPNNNSTNSISTPAQLTDKDHNIGVSLLNIIKHKNLMAHMLRSLEQIMCYWRGVSANSHVNKSKAPLAGKLATKPYDIKQLLKSVSPSSPLTTGKLMGSSSVGGSSGGTSVSNASCRGSAYDNLPMHVTDLLLRMPFTILKLCKSLTNISSGTTTVGSQPAAPTLTGLILCELAAQITTDNKWNSVLCELLEFDITGSTGASGGSASCTHAGATVSAGTSESVNRLAKSLLNQIVGSKHYRTVRDIHLHGKCFSEITKLLVSKQNSSSTLTTTISSQPLQYLDLVKVTELIDQCIVKASERPHNWKLYCAKCPEILSMLMESSIVIHQHQSVALKLIYMLHLAVLDTSNSSASKTPSDKKTSATTASTAAATSTSVASRLEGKLARQLSSRIDINSVISQFVLIYVHNFPDAQIRWFAQAIINALYTKNKPNSEIRRTIVSTVIVEVWQKTLHTGQASLQLMDLIGHILSNENAPSSTDANVSPEIDEQTDTLTKSTIQLLLQTLQNYGESLLNKRWSSFHSGVGRLVNLPYKLDSEPSLCMSQSCQNNYRAINYPNQLRIYRWDSEPSDSRRTQARAVTLSGMGLHTNPESELISPSVRANINTHVFNLRAPYTLHSLTIKMAATNTANANGTVTRATSGTVLAGRHRPPCNISLFYCDMSTISTTQVLDQPQIWCPVSSHYLPDDVPELTITLAIPITAVYLIFQYNLATASSNGGSATGGTPMANIMISNGANASSTVSSAGLSQLGPNSPVLDMGSNTGSSHYIRCPRCHSSNIQGNVCLNCRDNVNQCFRCRAINYVGVDSFICASCSSCRYGRIDFSMNARANYDYIEQITSEEGRDIIMTRIANWSGLLDKAEEDLNQTRDTIEQISLDIILTDAQHYNNGVNTDQNQLNDTTNNKQPIVPPTATSQASSGNLSVASAPATGRKPTTIASSNKVDSRSYAQAVIDDVRSVGNRPYRRIRRPAGQPEQEDKDLPTPNAPSGKEDIDKSSEGTVGNPAIIHESMLRLVKINRNELHQHQTHVTGLWCQIHAAKLAVARYQAHTINITGSSNTLASSTSLIQAPVPPPLCNACTISQLQIYSWLINALCHIPHTRSLVASQLTPPPYLLRLMIKPGAIIDCLPSKLRSQFIHTAIYTTVDSKSQLTLLNSMILRELIQIITSHALLTSSPYHQVRVHICMMLLRTSLSIQDSLWELRLQPSIQLLRYIVRYNIQLSQQSLKLVVAPCLALLQAASATKSNSATSPSKEHIDINCPLPIINLSQWQTTNGIFDQWHHTIEKLTRLTRLQQPQAPLNDRDKYLLVKYTGKWMNYVLWSRGSTVDSRSDGSLKAVISLMKSTQQRIDTTTNTKEYMGSDTRNKVNWLTKVILSVKGSELGCICEILESIALSHAGSYERRRVVLRLLLCSISETTRHIPQLYSATGLSCLVSLVIQLTQPQYQPNWRIWLVNVCSNVTATGGTSYNFIGQLEQGIHTALRQLNLAEKYHSSTADSSTERNNIGAIYDGNTAFQVVRCLTDLLLHLLQYFMGDVTPPSSSQQLLPHQDHYRTVLVRCLLSASLTLRQLVIFRSKATTDAELTYNSTVDSLSKQSEQSIENFIKIAVDVMKDFPQLDLQSSGAIIDKINAYICPKDYEHLQFDVVLEIFKGQEDFLPHRMVGVALSCKQFGHNATVNDVMNFMVRENGLTSDIKLDVICDKKVLMGDLLLEDVFEQVWLVSDAGSAAGNRFSNQQQANAPSTAALMNKPMRLILRISGLTEDQMPYVETLKREVPIQHYLRSNALLDNGGLSYVLTKLNQVDSLTRGSTLVAATGKLLGYFIKVPDNIHKLLTIPTLNTCPVLLKTLLICVEDLNKLDEKRRVDFCDNTIIPMINLSRQLLEMARKSSPEQVEDFIDLSLASKLLDLVLYAPSLDLHQKYVSGLIPLLIVSDTKQISQIFDRLEPYLNDLKPGAVFSEYQRHILLCCCQVLTSVPADSFGLVVRNAMLDRGFLQICIHFLEKAASACSLDLADLDQQSDDDSFPNKLDVKKTEVMSFLQEQGLTLILQLGRACAIGSTQLYEHPAHLLTLLHCLELVKAVESVGVLAEDWLSAIITECPSDDKARQEVEQLRRDTRQKVRQRALQARKRQMQNMRANQANATAAAAANNVASAEEPGYVCAICQDGHVNKPQEPLAIYTYIKKLHPHDLLTNNSQANSSLPSTSASSSSNIAYSSVSSFVCVHYTCHSHSVKMMTTENTGSASGTSAGGGTGGNATSASLQNTNLVSTTGASCTSGEWSLVQRHNQNAKCNSLMPILSPCSSNNVNAINVTYRANVTRYQSCVWSSATNAAANVSSSTNSSSTINPDSVIFQEQLFVHDLKYIVLRLCQQRHFNEDTGGGARLSNVRLIPHLIQLALFAHVPAGSVNSTTTDHPAVQLNFITDSVNRETSALNKWLQPDYQANVSSVWSFTNEVFRTVECLVLQPYKIWLQNRMLILRNLIQYAHLRHYTTGNSTSTTSIPSELANWSSVYRPMALLWAIIDLLYFTMLKPLNNDNVTTNSNEDSSVEPGKLYMQKLSNFLRNNETQLLESTVQFARIYEDKILPHDASLNELMNAVNSINENADIDSSLDDWMLATVSAVSNSIN